MESKLQDSGSGYLGVRLIDLQTSQPANCTLQCESRKCITSRGRRDPDCNGCSCRLTFYLTHTSPSPPPPRTLCFLGEASLAAASSTGCCPGAELRGFTQGGNAGGVLGPPGPEPQLWATTRCPPRRGPSEPQLILKITPRLNGLTEFGEGVWNRSKVLSCWSNLARQLMSTPRKRWCEWGEIPAVWTGRVLNTLLGISFLNIEGRGHKNLFSVPDPSPEALSLLLRNLLRTKGKQNIVN